MNPHLSYVNLYYDPVLPTRQLVYGEQHTQGAGANVNRHSTQKC